MRKELKKENGNRLRFRAVMERYGNKTNYHGFPERTVLFRNVVNVSSGIEVTDHIWFTVGKTIDKLGLCSGDVVEFDARVGEYEKGYVNHKEGIYERELDYKLIRPTRFVKIKGSTD